MILRLLTSRSGMIVMTALALLAWHNIEKLRAAKSAVASFIAKEELAISKAENEELNRRLKIADAAKEAFEKQRNAANVAALNAEGDLDEYIQKTKFNPECVVDPDFHSILRNN